MAAVFPAPGPGQLNWLSQCSSPGTARAMKAKKMMAKPKKKAENKRVISSPLTDLNEKLPAKSGQDKLKLRSRAGRQNSESISLPLPVLCSSCNGGWTPSADK